MAGDFNKRQKKEGDYMAIQNPASPLIGTVTTANELAKRPRIGEAIIQSLLFLSGAISILTTVGIVYILGSESLNFFTRELWENTNKTIVADLDAQTDTFEVSTSGAAINAGEKIRLGDEAMEIVAVEGTVVTVQRAIDGTVAAVHNGGLQIFRSNPVSPLDVITETHWSPQLGNFGIWPLVLATVMTSLIAMLVALPVGLGTAIYLSEYASERVRNILKPILEVLAGVPTVVYGYFALTFMTPFLRTIFGDNVVEIFNTASAGIVVGILIIPIVVSMSEDALHAVPSALREAAFGLGATKLETSLKIVLPAALSGITAAFVVAISRAIGETMAVMLANCSSLKSRILRVTTR